MFDQRLHLVLKRLTLVARGGLGQRDGDGTERLLIRIREGADLVPCRAAEDPIKWSATGLPENVEQRNIQSSSDRCGHQPIQSLVGRRVLAGEGLVGRF